MFSRIFPYKPSSDGGTPIYGNPRILVDVGDFPIFLNPFDSPPRIPHIDGNFRSHGGTPSHHPFIDGIFP